MKLAGSALVLGASALFWFLRMGERRRRRETLTCTSSTAKRSLTFPTVICVPLIHAIRMILECISSQKR